MFVTLCFRPKWWGGVYHPPTKRLYATPAFEDYILVVDTKGGLGQYATIPLTCYPCLSSSKHRAVCM